jgi:ankyrin repeat protein
LTVISQVELVEIALDSGKIKSNFAFSNGDSLLITACKSGFKKLAKALMRRGAPLDAVDPDGNTAAHWCFAMGYNDLTESVNSERQL